MTIETTRIANADAWEIVAWLAGVLLTGIQMPRQFLITAPFEEA